MSPSTDNPEVYLQYELLPPACRPVWVTRHDGATLISIDLRSTKLEATAGCADLLSPDELTYVRACFGIQPGGQAPDTWTSDELVAPVLPEALRLGRGQRQDLDARERRILAFEQGRWLHLGAKETAIRLEFGVPAVRYYQELNDLLDRPEALEHDPALVNRLRRVRETRRQSRAG